jgi:hypothetical protein
MRWFSSSKAVRLDCLSNGHRHSREATNCQARVLSGQMVLMVVR